MIKRFGGLLISVLLCEFVGLAGSIPTFPSIANWYQTLNKPGFTPPNWLFGPAWTTLYALMGISLFLVWEKRKKKGARLALAIFGLQLTLNFFWSIIFFGLHQPLFAFIEIILLWLAIFITIKKFYPISKTAGLILIPYLAWVSFASVLNFFIAKLN